METLKHRSRNGYLEAEFERFAKSKTEIEVETVKLFDHVEGKTVADILTDQNRAAMIAAGR